MVIPRRADDADASYGSSPLTLATWRRRVAELYAVVRAAPESEAEKTWRAFRTARDRLFSEHPDSPIPPQQRTAFGGVTFFDYRPACRVRGRVEHLASTERFDLDLGGDGVSSVRKVALVHFTLHGTAAKLSVYWIEGYGGGLWLPFADATNGHETYGAGRYLYDGIKGADLGADHHTMLLDFNYAYHPSCAWDPRWTCPLAPAENRLAFRVQAGERI